MVIENSNKNSFNTSHGETTARIKSTLVLINRAVIDPVIGKFENFMAQWVKKQH
jgi:hypothetical protein